MTGERESGQFLVSCGSVLKSQEIAIVDPQTRTRLGAGSIGEIWVRSPSVALGYWGKVEQTVETFQAFVQDSLEGPFLRTGDLGFCLEEELFVTGRLKDLIIIRGRNLSAQDIEHVVEKSHPLLRQGCCAAFGVEGPEGEQLVVVQEVRRHVDDAVAQEAIEAIRLAVLSAFDVEVVAIELLRTGTILKTSSGKIQRRACRSRFLKGELNAVYRWNHSLEHHLSALQSTQASAAPAEELDQDNGQQRGFVPAIPSADRAFTPYNRRLLTGWSCISLSMPIVMHVW